MPTSLEHVCSLCSMKGLKFFLDPRGNAVMIGFRLSDTFTPTVLVRLLEDGEFLGIACHDLPLVDTSNPMHAEVQEFLLAMNARCRFVKFAHDPSDGEISVMGDVWLEDVELTEALFARVIDNFLDCLHRAQQHLSGILVSARILGRPLHGEAA